ncbi:NAD dependent epimerase/dehydratase family [Synechococcus sp. PCC 7335]|uniref:SDR family oxidoreductase n=1 Tax=Synechococcus sp. (strain ATCC 29403 / PCC 7335) TaxID=91464 RepID=UPI00017EDC60|nr:SDR family oxidoreductase [Synechococcus sp. PCC 7335]EDX85839.1 NAD dependent epimerase/dehydratase family [Synechococcus sp. PCC 7335]
MKAAIIGCGYVGTAVAKLWRAKGFDLLVTTTRQSRVEALSQLADDVRIAIGTNASQMRDALVDRQVVLLCVGSHKDASYRDTYLGTARTLTEVLPSTDVQQIIYTSTCSVYGEHHGAWVTELMPPSPITENGKIIEATEQTLLSAIMPQRKVCILRLGGIYGPGRTLGKIYSRAAGTTRPGKGNEGTNWVYLDDIVGGIDWARQQQLSGLYNLVQDEVPTIRELISEVCDHHQLSPVLWDETQPSTRKNVRVSNAKIKSTGYQFSHPTFWE